MGCFASLTVNLILLEQRENRVLWTRSDRRAEHLRKVLRPSPGDRIDVGCINGPRGVATIRDCSQAGDWTLDIEWGTLPELPPAVDLLFGLPRPQTARKLLNTATTLGARRLIFFTSEKGEASYRESKLWSTPEWRRHLIEGAEQAFSTWIPEVLHFRGLAEALENRADHPGLRLALDNYEAEALIDEAPRVPGPLLLAIGAERGWSRDERSLLREGKFNLLSLGTRVLRTETALAYALGALSPGRDLR